jgi:Kef-type K+ transport system membrane component KefB
MLDLVLILLLGTGVGWAATRSRLPAAAAQVLLGIVIGVPVLGWIQPGPGLEVLGELGVVLLLGMAGLQLGLTRLTQVGWMGFWVALLGIVFSFAGGHTFAAWWGSPHPEALYVGIALTATSIGISVQVLQQFGLIDSRVGQAVVAAAIIDDVVALYLLAVAHGVLSDGLEPWWFMGSVILAGLMLTAIFFITKFFARIVVLRFQHVNPLFILVLVTVVIMVFGWLTSEAGYSLVVGGFFAGLGLGEGFGKTARTQIARQLQGPVRLLIPFFFVLIGTQADWTVLADPGMLTLLVGLLVVALAGKTLGGVFGAMGSGSFAQRLLIGICMVPRGEVALVIASLGFQQGHISHHVLVVLVLITVCVALLGPLLMMPLAHYQQRASR